MTTVRAKVTSIFVMFSLVSFFITPTTSNAASDEFIFTKNYAGEIFKRPLDGTGSSTQVGTVGTGIGLMGYGSYIYICFGSIRRMSQDGTGLVTLNSAAVYSCATDGTYIYYGYENTQSIGRMNLNGTSANDNWVTFTNSGLNSGWMTVSNGFLFFGGGANATSKVLGKVSLSGGSVSAIYTDSCAISGVSSDGTYLYLAHYVCNTVGRVLQDGTSANSNFITGLLSGDSWGTIVWGGKLYILNNTRIVRANLDGTSVEYSYLTGVGTRGIAILGTQSSATTLSSFSVPTLASKGVGASISATFSAQGRVTFYAGSKKIAGCIQIPTSSTSPYQASCNWKPAVTGSTTISASFVGTSAGNLPLTTVLDRARVVKRTTTR